MTTGNRDRTSGTVWRKRSRRMAAAICAAALGALPAPAPGQDGGGSVVDILGAPQEVLSPVTVGAAYRSMAENPADFALLRTGVEMQRAGRPRVDVLEELLRRRDASESLFGEEIDWLGNVGQAVATAAGGAIGAPLGLAAWANWWPVPAYYMGAAGAAAGIGAVAGGAVAGGVAAGWVVASLDDWIGDVVTGRRQREAARVAQESPWEAVIFSEDYRNLHATFENPDYWEPIWRAVFEPRVGVALDDGAVEALVKVPELEAESRDDGTYHDLLTVTKWLEGTGMLGIEKK